MPLLRCCGTPCLCCIEIRCIKQGVLSDVGCCFRPTVPSPTPRQVSLTWRLVAISERAQCLMHRLPPAYPDSINTLQRPSGSHTHVHGNSRSKTQHAGMCLAENQGR